DSFFTGVTEGNIGSDRIISMMNVHNDELVIDLKGIYSIEKFLISRMFMYWQVYLHKTAFGVELYLIQALKRAKELYKLGEKVPATQALEYFLERDFNKEFSSEDIDVFLQLDDNDVLYAIKQWQNHSDVILRTLAISVVQRRLPKVEIRNNPVSISELEEKRQAADSYFGAGASDYFVHQSV